MRLFSSLIINYSLKSSRFFFLPTNSAVLSVPARAAFTLAIPACPVLIAAWVTRSLITGCAHPSLLAAAGASDTNAVSSAVGCTNLCGRGEKREEGIWVERRERGKIQSVIVKKSSHTSLPRLTGQWKEFLELITLILPDNKNLISILQKRDGHGLQRSAVIDPPIYFLIFLHSSSFCDHQIRRERLFQ